MALPTSLADMRDEDGDELVIELSTPMWGEEPAGPELEVKLHSGSSSPWGRVLAKAYLPAMHSYTGSTGVAHLVTIVDDLLIKETNSTTIIDATLAALKAAFNGDVEYEYEPTSFAGYKIARDHSRRALTRSMPEKAVEAACNHLPELLAGKPVFLPSGKKLMDMADSMKLESNKKLSKLTNKHSANDRQCQVHRKGQP